MIRPAHHDKHRSAGRRADARYAAAGCARHIYAHQFCRGDLPHRQRRLGYFSSRLSRQQFLRVCEGFQPARIAQSLCDQSVAYSAVSAQVHSFVPFVGRRLDDDEPSERPNGTILYWSGELHNDKGARQHECC